MKKILLIEDDTVMRENTAEILELAQYKMFTAPNGKKGCVLAKEISPDLIICDVMMPNLDGFEFVRAIKGSQSLQRVPVIFLTAKIDPRSMIDGINVGARFYVTKPFQIDDLLSKVRRALSTR